MFATIKVAVNKNIIFFLWQEFQSQMLDRTYQSIINILDELTAHIQCIDECQTIFTQIV